MKNDNILDWSMNFKEESVFYYLIMSFQKNESFTFTIFKIRYIHNK